ncbi:uncharacterized protein EV422DRAFT_225201 [Fimicolochytrium jonesii]|uniref:uncharacterized protein n=1 Tax=Fimicolochytrium jonesii TaxID=1396493 RepID=UPI0022FE1153|nr:uncharacterized protein EV422DRAFT_225201 [Fimicolochytrium jonesii]KAI8817445.1 hypothetical protein EV422DRAFT_225201 [Fimicolochytrium jonesii]
MLSRFNSYAKTLKESLADAATSFETEQKNFLSSRREKDGGVFTEPKEEVALLPDVVVATPAQTSNFLKGLLTKAVAIPGEIVKELSAEVLVGGEGATAAGGEEKEVGGDEARVEEGVRLPWDGAEDADLLRRAVQALSKQPAIFLEEVPSDVPFDFDLEASYPVIMELLKLDEELGRTRFRLVPRKIKEPQFWQRFFYQVHLLQTLPLAELESKMATHVESLADVEATERMLGTTVVTAPAHAATSDSIAALATPDKTTEPDILFAAPPLSDSPEPARKRQTPPPPAATEPEGELPSAQDLRDAHVPVPQNLEDGNYDDEDFAHEEFVSDMYDGEWQED